MSVASSLEDRPLLRYARNRAGSPGRVTRAGRPAWYFAMTSASEAFAPAIEAHRGWGGAPVNETRAVAPAGSPNAAAAATSKELGTGVLQRGGESPTRT